MRTHVEFRSDAFPAEPGEDEEVNPGQFGKRLAGWVHDVLREAGIAATTPIAEDWGWVVPIDEPAFRLWIGCGNYEEFDDGFLVFVHPHRPQVRRGLRKVDTAPVIEPITAAIDAALRSRPDVRDLRWWTEDEIPR